MNICLPFFLSLIPPLDSEFEEFEEFTPIEEVYEEFVGESLIGSKEWKEYLREYDPHVNLKPIDHIPWIILYERYIKKNSNVIDYGSKRGEQSLIFSRLLGSDGKVFIFESNPQVFRALFWNLVHNKVKNALIFCPEAEEQLDFLDLENVSFIRIDADGKEQLILKGAEKTIARCKPVIILNMLGGIPIEQGDRYIKNELDRRISAIRKMGYSAQKIKDCWYLCLPENKN